MEAKAAKVPSIIGVGCLIRELKKWFNPGSNWRPPVHTSGNLQDKCETDVITNYTIKPW